jgi:exo-1,4-beta-D-glucosaminidase
MLHAGTVTPLRDGWQLQSACKLQATGDSIAADGFQTGGWLKTAVPSTVLASQAAAGVFPDPYYGMNLRQIPGTTYQDRRHLRQHADGAGQPLSLRLVVSHGVRAPAASASGRARVAALWRHQLSRRRVAERAQDCRHDQGCGRLSHLRLRRDGVSEAGQENVLAVETFAPTEKDLGINWVDWNPCPPDKDMGLWGAVDLVTTGAVTLRSPLAVTHFVDSTLELAELTVYAELHNASDRAVKGVVEGTAAGVKFEQPVELAAHEDRTVQFAPEQFAQLRFTIPSRGGRDQMGEPHLERLTMSFREQGEVTDEQSVDFGIREITSELTANGSRLFRVNGKPILIRGAGWSQDMLLRTDEHGCAISSAGRRYESEHDSAGRESSRRRSFFIWRMNEGILVMLGWCCCDHWEHWKDWTAEDLTIATASLAVADAAAAAPCEPAGVAEWQRQCAAANVERAYLDVEAETHWPNPIHLGGFIASDGGRRAERREDDGPYDYVAPSYWYVDKQNGGAYGFNTETSPGPAIPSLASREKFLPDPQAWPPTADWSYALRRRGI